MNWILLIIAGLFEVAFASCLGKAKETTFKIFDTYKKAHGMPSYG